MLYTRFEKVDYKDFDYKQELATFPNDVHDYMEYLQLSWIGNVVQLLALKLKSVGEEENKQDDFYFIVSNTHSYYRWDHSYTRLRQNKFLVEQAILFNDEICKKHNFTKHIPMITCGDFNISPDAVNYTVLTKNRVFNTPEQVYDEYKNIPASFFEDMTTTIMEYYEPIIDKLYPNLVNEKEQTPYEVKHVKQLKVKEHAKQIREEQVFKITKEMHETLPYLHSVYSNYSSLVKIPQSEVTKHLWENEPPYTNFVDTFKATLDYIFVYKEMHQAEGNNVKIPVLNNQLNHSIVPLRIIEIPMLENYAPDGIPSEQFPSDHIPILCEFSIGPVNKN